MRTETDIRSFDFSNGVRIGQSEIDQWRKEAVQFILDGNGNSAIKSSGNSIVIAQRVHYSHKENPSIVVFEIMNGYKRYEYSDVEIKSKENPEQVK